MVKKQTLTEEQIDSIKHYGEKIQTLKDFITSIQKKPGMYIGYLGNKGFLNMIREIFQNSIDEVMRKDSPCNAVRVLYNELSKLVQVEDNGRGIPFDNIIRVFTQQHTSSNYEKMLFDYTSGTHGIGSKATNALSSEFIIQSYVLGEGREVKFIGGYPESDKEKKISNKENKQGTIVSFLPNEELLGQLTVTCDDVLQLIKSILPLTYIGTIIQFDAITKDGKQGSIVLNNEDGITSYLIDNCVDPIIKPIEFSDDNGTTRAHIMFTYSATSTSSLTSFANFCPVDKESAESTHTKGFFAGLKKFMIPYMNKIFLASSTGKKKKNLVIIDSDIKTGLHIVLDVAHLDPIFTGQAKDVLSNEDMFGFVRDLTFRSLQQWSKDNPQELQKWCKFIKEQAIIRTSTDEKKVKLSNNYNPAIGGLPSKFVKPTKKFGELFIVEGDSAGGSAKNHRINETQGIIPIRGKIQNCFEKPISECMLNAEIAGITAIIGGGYGKNFDINKVKWEKVISAADADSAGNHINALLLIMVLVLFPDLIRYGKFYRAVPPLYMITINKGRKNENKLYFPDRISLVRYVQKEFSKHNEICTLGGRKLPPKDVEALLYNNYFYIYELNKISNYCKVMPEIIEIFLNNRTKSSEEICKIIKAQYRFMNPVIYNNKIVCDGIANGVSNTLFIDNDKLLEHCKPLLEIMSNNMYSEYLVNGKRSTILDIMKIYQNTSPSGINRLKGLGEQDPDELASSVIYPGELGNRTLIQYTMSSAAKEIEEIRYLNNNKNKLLENLSVSRLDITD